MKRLRILLTTITMLAIGVGIGAFVAQPAMAAPCTSGIKCVKQGADQADTGGTGTLQSNVSRITNGLMFIVGVIAMITIVVAGIMYATAGGDSNRVTAAKNTLTYAIVGVVVALLGYAIVQWVVRIL